MQLARAWMPLANKKTKEKIDEFKGFAL